MTGYYSISEFAKLCYTTRDTLLHYDRIGILKPSFKANNGYRYYSFAQYETYQIIYTLRQTGLPLSTIKEHMSKRTSNGLLNLLSTTQQDLDKKIEHLMHLKDVISHERNEMEVAMQNLNKFSFIDLKTQYIIRIEHPIYSDDTFRAASLKLDAEAKKMDSYISYVIGVYGSLKNMYKYKSQAESRNMMNFDGIYMRVKRRERSATSIAKGKYIVTYKFFDFENESIILERAKEFAAENGYEIDDELYQESFGGPFESIDDPKFLAKYLFKVKE